MSKGGSLKIESRYNKNNKKVEIKFIDTGGGIAREHLDKIFDPFFTTKGPTKGVGLGLSISHGIITNHKGTIEVKSQSGKGTTFIVRFPTRGKQGSLKKKMKIKS